MKLKYNGFINGELRTKTGSITVKRGEIYDVPDDMVEDLLKLGYWEQVKVNEKKKKNNDLEV